MDRKALDRLEPGLPSSWYRDPTHYERELEAFWYSRWIAVAREEELPQAGDWRVARIGTQSIVVVRGEDGELRAFHNTCRHRGSVLCTEASGNFARKRIVCPYHSWTYDLGGQLVATPRRMQSAPLAAIRLLEYIGAAQKERQRHGSQANCRKAIWREWDARETRLIRGRPPILKSAG